MATTSEIGHSRTIGLGNKASALNFILGILRRFAVPRPQRFCLAHRCQRNNAAHGYTARF